MKQLENSKGKIFYGLHMYPGVAEYQENDGSSYRIFLNENTIRKMNPTFAGRPVYLMHVDEVTPDLEELRKEADGWVIESFFNSCDGKTWTKFITVTEKAINAIEKKGFRLSNAYLPKSFGKGGMWNGVTYEKEVLDGEYEHLAIVGNPRYEESMVLNAEEFKNYCNEKESELKKIANSKEIKNNKKEITSMKLSFFKKSKVENSADFENMSVTLPKSGVEKTLSQLVLEADALEETKGIANALDKVKVGEVELTVQELAKSYAELLKNAKKKNEDEEEEEDDSTVENEEEDDSTVENEEEDEKAKKKALELAEHEQKEIEEAKKNKKKNFLELKNAHKKKFENAGEEVNICLSEDRVKRGKELFGN